MTNEQNSDPLNFMRNMWGNMGFSLPGMIAPTFDLDELDKRIKDMKAVEGWLRMNLSMLQMTIQGLEMQRTTVSTVQTMGQMASNAARSMSAAPEEAPPAEEATASPLAGAAMWPWQMMDQIREQMQQHAESVSAEAASEPAAEKPASRRSKK
jgi:hypothetical protein